MKGFKIQPEAAAAGEYQGTIYRLSDVSQTVELEVWPQCGFNALRWRTRENAARPWQSLFYAAPDWSSHPVPTRSGHPILFPFPNRLRAGTFRFQEQVWNLPKNESSGQHAIHGFTPKRPWRVLGCEANRDYAMITGEFRFSVDLPGWESLWPADGSLTVSYQLESNRLTVQAFIQNHGAGPLPYGLGYHPYFVLPGVSDEPIDDYELQAGAEHFWPLEHGLPTGPMTSVPPEYQFEHFRRIGSLELDHLLSGRRPAGRTIAILRHPRAAHQLRIEADAAFGHLLLFTPPHRKSIAIEPYTCVTDALNLAADGERPATHTGLRVLKPGQSVSLEVSYYLELASQSFATTPNAL